MITIKVFRSGGGPQVNAEVRVKGPNGISTGRTDSRGIVDFNLKRGKYQVFVGGKSLYNDLIVDVATVYVR